MQKQVNALWRQVEHLENASIGIRDAAEKYRIPLASLYRWIGNGHIRVVNDVREGGRGRKRLLNEADVAYAALLAAQSGRRRGHRVFTAKMMPPHSRLAPA